MLQLVNYNHAGMEINTCVMGARYKGTNVKYCVNLFTPLKLHLPNSYTTGKELGFVFLHWYRGRGSVI